MGVPTKCVKTYHQEFPRKQILEVQAQSFLHGFEIQLYSWKQAELTYENGPAQFVRCERGNPDNHFRQRVLNAKKVICKEFRIKINREMVWRT